MGNFDVNTELSALRKQTIAIRKRCYSQRKSRLDKFKYELLSLHQSGATIAELQRFLRNNRIKVVHSTVYRWIEKHG